MSKGKHTPGPWSIMRTPSGYLYIEHYPNGKRIESSDSIAEVNFSEDAQLISACPDMLTALEKSLPLLATYNSQEWNDARKLVYQAINKAKGLNNE